MMRQLALMEASKRERKKEYYRKILEKCKDRIMAYCGNNKFFCVYKVPPYVIGWPLYSWERAIAYVMKKLMKDGFEVHYIGDSSLFISWESVRKPQPEPQPEPQSKPSNTPDLSFLEELAGKYK